MSQDLACASHLSGQSRSFKKYFIASGLAEHGFLTQASGFCVFQLRDRLPSLAVPPTDLSLGLHERGQENPGRKDGLDDVQLRDLPDRRNRESFALFW